MPTHTYMDLALDEAHAAADAGEVPIGCVITCDGDLIAQAGSLRFRNRPANTAPAITNAPSSIHARLASPFTVS